MSTARTLATFVVVAASLLGCPAERRPACDPSSAAGASQRLCNPHSVVLVRHAEKAVADAPDPDPDLSAKGHERAVRLARLLGKTAITRLVASDTKRTQQTLAPLAERTGKAIDVRPAAQANDLVRELRNAPPGSTTVVATHSNVLPMIVRDLGGGQLRDLTTDGMLPDDDYARVLVLSVGCSTSASVVELSSD
ncbi:MAG: Phosphoglycerate mutase [Myxococcaceae bacterium]|nr:Phosphoglycerate mutase [Myxococcaceae bacterium]